METLSFSSPANPKIHALRSSASSPTRRQWSLPRRLMSMGFTGLSRTTSNIESKTYSRHNCSEEYSHIKYIDELEYEAIKDELLNELGFTIDQLIELQGLSIASAVVKTYPNHINTKTTQVLICCGTETIGKSGLVAARHLKLFGFRPTIFNPQPGKSPQFTRLIRQCQEYEISFLSYLPHESRLIAESYQLIIDVMDNCSLIISSQSNEILTKLIEVCDTGTPIISVDVPLGWNTDEGPPKNGTPVLLPDCLISLIAPKKCAKYFTGHNHWLGGRVVLPSLSRKYQLNLPEFLGSEQIVALSRHDDF